MVTGEWRYATMTATRHVMYQSTVYSEMAGVIRLILLKGNMDYKWADLPSR